MKDNGLEALDSLPESDKAYMAPLPIPFEASEESDQMFALMRMMSGSHSDGPSYYAEAQALKDATMAWSIAEAFAEGCPDGSPVRQFIHEGYLPGKRIVTVCCVRQDDISSLDEENAGRADFIIAVPVDMTMTF